jgi:hypothetical protein
MRLVRRLPRGLTRVVVVGALFALAACDQPTAPEMIAEADRVQRDFATGASGSTERLWRRLDMLMALDVAPVVGEAVFELDGRPERYRTFVFESVIVPLDSLDGYTCPRVIRTLVAARDDRRGVMLRGADFDQPVVPLGNPCDGRLPIDQWWPTLTVVPSPNGPSMTGVRGQSRIEQVADSSGTCEMFSPGNPSVRNQRVPFYHYTRVDCARLQFEVSADVELARHRVDSGAALAPKILSHDPKRFTIARQVVPGVRFTVYCTPKIPDLTPSCIRDEMYEANSRYHRPPAPAPGPEPPYNPPSDSSAPPPWPAPPAPALDAPPAPPRPTPRRPSKRPVRPLAPAPRPAPAVGSPPNHGPR